MKKLLTLLATLAVAVTLSMPVFASPSANGQETSSSQTATKHKKEKKQKKEKKHKSSKKSKKGSTEPAPGQ